jgi:hypothetical protein
VEKRLERGRWQFLAPARLCRLIAELIHSRSRFARALRMRRATAILWTSSGPS